MKRRSLVMGISAVGIAGVSGCLGIFSDDSDPEAPETETNTSGEDNVSVPYSSLERDEITNEFLEQHFDTLADVGSYTVNVESTDDDIERTWRRTSSVGIEVQQEESGVIKERFYNGEVLGVREPSSNNVNLLQQQLPLVEDWANAQNIQYIISNSVVSLENEEESNVIYTGLLEEENTTKELTVKISKNRPALTEVNVADEQTYSLSSFGSTEVSQPDWFETALNNNVIASGGVFGRGDSLLIQVSESGANIPSGSIITVITPTGSTKNIEVDQTISSGSSVYIVFRGGRGYYSIGSLPPVSDRDQLENGTYVINTINSSGEQLFELQMDVSGENN